MPVIEVRELCKNYKVFKRQKGFANNLKSLVNREYEVIEAVKDVSFTLEQGDLVGYVGANGAGKSTTIKMLCGILTPTSGDIFVNGITPHENRKKNAKQIGVVFGQRSQLNWDLPTEDTFELYKRMYRIEDSAYKHNVGLFTELLGMKDFFRRPVRQLSLGQKMRAEIAIALLHDPKILYLDEPSIGLDVAVKSRIRKFIRDLRSEKNTTVILTTHDMTDIDEICDRIIIIDKGQKIADQSLNDYKSRYNGEYYIEIEFDGDAPKEIDNRLEVIAQAANRITCRFLREDIPARKSMQYFLTNFDVRDINIRNPKLEEIVRRLYENL